jgi:hypothetical protein
VTTRKGDEQEVTVWALMLVLGLSILMAGYILCAKTSGFACRTSPIPKHAAFLEVTPGIIELTTSAQSFFTPLESEQTLAFERF